LNYNTLAFTIHRKCSAACSMCCFESTPICTETLDRERILAYIDESKDIDEIKTVSFTGGEPFMTFSDLVRLVRAAKAARKRVTTISNSFWATSYENAYNKLAILKEAGLDHLSLSHDSYHKEYVKTEYVKNVLNAAIQLGIQTTLAMVVVKDEKIGNIINDLGSGLYGPTIEIVPCLPAGGARTTFKDDQFFRSLSVEGLRCIYDGNIVVTYSGKIYPCCSQMVMDTELTVGDYTNLSLKEALNNIKNNGLLYLLRNENFDYLIDVAKNNIGIDVPDKVVNVCELCAILFKDGNISKFKPYIFDRIQESSTLSR
jgi:YydG family peptide modification radical SAM enzyme